MRFEEYIQDVKLAERQKQVKKMKIEAEAYRHQCKSEPAHDRPIETEYNEIKEQQWSYAAG